MPRRIRPRAADFQRPVSGLDGRQDDLEQFFDFKNGRFALNDPKAAETFGFIQGLNNARLIAPGQQHQEVLPPAVRRRPGRDLSRRHLDAERRCQDSGIQPDEFAVGGATRTRTAARPARWPAGTTATSTGSLADRAPGGRGVDVPRVDDQAGRLFRPRVLQGRLRHARLRRPAKYARHRPGSSRSWGVAGGEAAVPGAGAGAGAQVPGHRQVGGLPRRISRVRPNGEWEVMNQALVDGKPLDRRGQGPGGERQQNLEDSAGEGGRVRAEGVDGLLHVPRLGLHVRLRPRQVRR